MQAGKTTVNEWISERFMAFVWVGMVREESSQGVVDAVTRKNTRRDAGDGNEKVNDPSIGGRNPAWTEDHGPAGEGADSST